MHRAVAASSAAAAEIVRALLKAKADADTALNGSTPLRIALDHNADAEVRALRPRGS